MEHLEFDFDIEITNLPKEINQFCIVKNMIFISTKKDIIIYKDNEILEKRPGKHSLFQMDDRVIMVSFEDGWLRVAIYTDKNECHKTKTELSQHIKLDLYDNWIQGVISTPDKLIINQIRFNEILNKHESLIWKYNMSSKSLFDFDSFIITKPKFLLYNSEFNYSLENYENCVKAFKGCRIYNYKSKLQFHLNDCHFQRENNKIKNIEYKENIISYIENENIVWIFPDKQKKIEMSCGYLPLYKLISNNLLYILYEDNINVYKMKFNNI